ncbi:MAG: ABC transporter permease, partial [Planctomycetes bacterium]|nr:ABC transporter permease [Planctomycetota bacterium]
MKLVLRNIMRRKGRSLYAIIGITIAISIIVAITTISEGVRKSVTDLLLNYRGDLLVFQDSSTGFHDSKLPDTLGKVIEKIKGVEKVEPYSVHYTVIKPVPPDKDDLNFLEDIAVSKLNLQFAIMGVSTETSSIFDSMLDMEEFEKHHKTDENKIYLGASIISQIENKLENIVEMLRKDKKMSAFSDIFLVEATANDFPVLKIRDKKYKFPKFKVKNDVFEVGGIFKTDTMQDAQAFIDINKYKILFDQKGLVSSYMIYLSNIRELDSVKKEILKIKSDKVLKVQKPIELMEMFSDRIETMENIIWALMILAAFSGSIGVLNTMASNVSERTKEIGLLQAVGWSKA